MPGATTTTTKPTPTTVGSRTGWTVNCQDEKGVPANCGFQIRNENKTQLVKFVIQHVKETHNMNYAEKDVLAIAKPAKW